MNAPLCACGCGQPVYDADAVASLHYYVRKRIMRLRFVPGHYTHPSKRTRRNKAVAAGYRAGKSVSFLARRFGISAQRVCDLLRQQGAPRRVKPERAS